MKKNKGSKLVALLLAALIVTSSSALVYAAETDEDSESYTIVEVTDSSNATVKWLQADLTTPSMVSNYVSDSVIISQTDAGYSITITLNEEAAALISAVKNPDGTDAEKISDDQYKISTSSIEDAVPVGFTVSAMGSTQTAYMEVDVSEDDTGIDVSELTAGTYLLSAKAITESTYGGENPSEFVLSRQFDSNIKLIISENRNWSTGETTKSLKIALLYKPSKTDMQKLAIDDVTGTKREFGVAEAGTAYEFVMDIADLEKDHKLSFSYDTGIPRLGDNGVMTHSVYLTDYAVDEWNGYSWISDQIPADGEYTLSAKAITESTYGTENESEFALTRQFDPKMKLSVQDGQMSLSLLYLPSSIDMIKLAIDDTVGTKNTYGSDETGTAYEFTMPVTNLTKDRKLSFTYNTGRFVMTHSVYLKDLQIESWDGYDWKEKAAELTNTAAIDSDTIQLGTSLTVNMGAEGGEGDYTYSVLYKKATGTKWAVAQKPTTDTAATVKPAAAEGTTGDYQYTVMYKKLTGTKWAVAQKYDANAEITFTPAAATEYEVCVKARDNNGTVAKKYFIVSVTK